MQSRFAVSLKALAVIVVVTLIMDVGLAQLCKQFWPFWDVRAIGRSFRTASPIYHHDLRPMRRVDTLMGRYVYPIRTNSLGFRDKAVREVPLSSERRRILFIGDSFTEGVGMAYEQTFVGLIGACLEDEAVEVFNAGVVSYQPAIYLRKIRHLLETGKFRFDEAVVFIDISDIFEEHQLSLDNDEPYAAKSGDEQWRAGEELNHLLRTNSVIYRVGHRVFNIDFGYRLKAAYWRLRDWLGRGLAVEQPKPVSGEGDTKPKPPAQHGLSTDMPEAALKDLLQGKVDVGKSLWTIKPERYEDDVIGKGFGNAKRAMNALRTLLDKHGVALTVVVYPWPDQLFYEDRESVQVQEWRAWTSANGARFVNLFPTFFDVGPKLDVIRDYFIQYDVHWNAAGHRLVAGSYLSLSGRPTCGLPTGPG